MQSLTVFRLMLDKVFITLCQQNCITKVFFTCSSIISRSLQKFGYVFLPKYIKMYWHY